jgi:uncharacterized protein YegL
MDRTQLLSDPSQNFGGTTLAVLVIDRSGSMQAVKADTIGGLNQWKNGLAASDPNARLTVVQFDTEYEVVHDNVKVSDVPDWNDTTYVPRGGTALLDAVNKALAISDARTKDDSRVLFVVATDGEENSSVEVKDATLIRDQITEREGRGNHTFVFLNASPDRFLSQSLGFAAANTLTYAGQNRQAQTQAFTQLTRSTAEYVAASAPAAGGFFSGDREDEDDPGKSHTEDPSSGFLSWATSAQKKTPRR